MLGMGIFGANSGETLTFDTFSAAVPEPSVFAAVILGSLLFFAGRRRAA